MISIALERKVNYIVTWEKAVINLVKSKYADAGFVALTPEDFHGRS